MCLDIYTSFLNIYFQFWNEVELLTTERKDDFLAQAKKNMDRLIGMVVKAKRCTKGKCIP